MSILKTRNSWDEYFMSICDKVASRSTCDRRAVGAIIVKNNRIISTGYNGSIPKTPHCSDPEEYWQCSYCGKTFDAKIESEVEEAKIQHKNSKCGSYSITKHSFACAGHKIVKKKGGHLLENNHCERTIHAETNAIVQAARFGVCVEDSILYVNTFPCWTCFKNIISAGIREIIYRDDYESERSKYIKDTLGDLKDIIVRKISS